MIELDEKYLRRRGMRIAIEIGRFIYIGARQKSRVNIYELRAQGVSPTSNDPISVILIRSGQMRCSLGTFKWHALPCMVRETMPNKYKLRHMDYFEANTSAAFPEIWSSRGQVRGGITNSNLLEWDSTAVKCRKNQKSP